MLGHMGNTPAPKAVQDLVERFDQNRDAYLSGSYNETQLRREFIDPLFEALGWDVENRQGSAFSWFLVLGSWNQEPETRNQERSGLFDFRKEREARDMTEMSDISDRVPSRAEPPDKLTTELDIDDKLLSDILSELYPPKSPYEFSVIGIEILGEVYEQFLGKVIRLTAGHQAKVEEKPEVRKAGGVHYTPQYIVNYIVKNTIGKLREGGSPARLTNACRYPKMQPMAAQARPDSTEVESFMALRVFVWVV
jgi:type I restriction-modification system DNA methylase subunit